MVGCFNDASPTKSEGGEENIGIGIDDEIVRPLVEVDDSDMDVLACVDDA